MTSQPVKNIKRVLKDYATLVEEGPEQGIFVKTLNDDVSVIYMMIMGPGDSPYEGCPMFFTIEPGTQWNPGAQGRQYPVEPPRVIFHSPYSIRCHPNLYKPGHSAEVQMPNGTRVQGGKVCLSILGTWMGEGWVAFMTFMTIAQTIMGILDYHPLCNEPAWYNKPSAPKVQTYTEYVQYVCAKETVELIATPLFTGGDIAHPIAPMFAEELAAWFTERKSDYVNRLLKLSETFAGDRKVQSGGVYGDNSYVGKKYDFDAIAQKFIDLV